MTGSIAIIVRQATDDWQATAGQVGTTENVINAHYCRYLITASVRVRT
jgi:hypothetical protein